MIAPVAARPGEYLTLWGRDEENVTVIDRSGSRVLQCATIPFGEVSGALLHLCVDGVITGLTISDEWALQRSA